MAKNKRDIKREDVVTEADKIAYSRMMYDRWESIPDDALPSYIIDNAHLFPLESEPWHSPEYWIAAARAQEQKERALRALKRADKRQANRRLNDPTPRILRSLFVASRQRT
jgi:hypothetical protein